MRKSFLFGLVFFAAFQVQAQKVGYIASQVIRERWQDMIQAQQRIQSLVDDWKRELATMQKQIDEMDLEVKKKRGLNQGCFSRLRCFTPRGASNQGTR